MHLFIAYLKFLLKSTNHHGVHSPFVFGLVTKCFYDKNYYPSYNLLRDYRKKLLQDKNTIKVTDFGAGSRVFSSENRKISAIAKNAGISPKRARLLNRLVRYLEVDNALELGTSLGIGTAALAAGNKVQVTTIEGCQETAAVARKQFEKFGFDNIELVVGEFDKILVESGEWRVESDRKYEIRSTKLEVEGEKWSEDRGQTAEKNVESEKWKEERKRNYKGRSTKLEVGREGNSNNSQPTTDEKPQTTNHKPQTTSPTAGEKNSKFQVPNSNTPNPEQQTTNNKPQTNPQPTTHNRQPTTPDGADLQSVASRQLTTDNSQPRTHNSILTTQYSLLFLDGNHRKQPTLDYFEKLLPLVHNDSVMIFDDIHWSQEMEEAWEEIKRHPSVKVTIDTFYQGFVFFRREQAKEHFVIRV